MFSRLWDIIMYMKRFLMIILIPALLVSCASTGMMEDIEKDGNTRFLYIEDMDDIRASISVGGRLCTLRLSSFTGERYMIVEEERGFRTYQLSELPVDDNGRRRLYSTAGNINIILEGLHIYISIGTAWTETDIERDYISPFIFDTHA